MEVHRGPGLSGRPERDDIQADLPTIGLGESTSHKVERITTTMTGTMTRNNHRPEPRVRGDICGPGRRRPRGCPRRLPGNGSIGPRPGSVSYTPRSLSSQMDWMVSGQRRPIRSMATTTRVSPLLPRCRNPVRFPSVQPISALTYPCHPPPELMTAGWWRYPRCWPGTRSARQPDGGGG